MTNESTAEASEVFVRGEPVLYQNEKAGSPAMLRQEAWVSSVAEAVGADLQHPHLVFSVSSLQRRGHFIDLDNLARPLLARIAPRARSVWAEIKVDSHVGVAVAERVPRPPKRVDEDIYLARPPVRSARSSGSLPELRDRSPLGQPEQAVGLWLNFDDASARVSDLGLTGTIKCVIDNLWPLLGGEPHRPADHRIHELQITRGANPGEAGVRIQLWLVTK